MGTMEGKDGEAQQMSTGLLLFGSKLSGDDNFYAILSLRRLCFSWLASLQLPFMP